MEVPATEPKETLPRQQDPTTTLLVRDTVAESMAMAGSLEYYREYGALQGAWSIT